MIVKELQNYLKKFPANSEVLLAEWDRKNQKTVVSDVIICCNRDTQEHKKEVWLGISEGSMRDA